MRLLGKMLLAVTLLLVAGAASCAAHVAWLTRDAPDRVEPIGPIDVVTHTTGYLAGWNTGRLRRATTEHYSLRFRGAPLVIRGRAGFSGRDTAEYTRVNAVVTFPDAPEPAVVVNVGDPNNASWFYLVRDLGGTPYAELLGPSQGGIAADWLDAPPGDTARARDVAVHRARLPAGGRWLLLGEHTVLDTRTLTRHAIAPPRGASPIPFGRALAVAPDGGSFVRAGRGDTPENAPCLLVFDFLRDGVHVIPVDRTTMRYMEWPDVDAAWLAHHFAWERDADGRDRLVRRPDAAPRPYHGTYSERASDGYREYRLLGVRPETYERFADWLARETGARRLTSPDAAAANAAAGRYAWDDWQIGDRVVHTGVGESHVSLWASGGPAAATVESIGRRFDDALRTGAFDALFLP